MTNNYVIECPVFHPTMADMEGSFEAYMAKIEKKFAHVGLAKIIPPAGWTPRKKGYKHGTFDFEIPRPIKQIATGKRGLYRTLLIEQKGMMLNDGFAPLATDEDNAPPKDADAETLERKFWQLITLKPPIYGADVPGTLFDKNLKGWNLRHLDSMLTRKLDELKLELPGVSTPFLYFGMWRSIFAWHTEDMDLHSVNYLHYGAPKSWYCVPPPYRERFETLLKSLLPDMFRHCPEFVRHKELMVSPGLLAQNNIPVVKTHQHPGEFIINYPGAYHSGFNTGYNCAESCNFATKAWLPVGLDARPCYCDTETVRIQMSIFANMVPNGKLRKALLESDPTDSESESGSDDSGSTSSTDDDQSSGSDSSSGQHRKRKAAKRSAVTGGRAMAPVSGVGGCVGRVQRSEQHKPTTPGASKAAAAPEPAKAAAKATKEDRILKTMYSELIKRGPSKAERAAAAAARTERALQRSRARMGLRTSVRRLSSSAGTAGGAAAAAAEPPKVRSRPAKPAAKKQKRAAVKEEAVAKIPDAVAAAVMQQARVSREERQRRRDTLREGEEQGAKGRQEQAPDEAQPGSSAALLQEHSSGSSHGTRIQLLVEAGHVDTSAVVTSVPAGTLNSPSSASGIAQEVSAETLPAAATAAQDPAAVPSGALQVDVGLPAAGRVVVQGSCAAEQAGLADAAEQGAAVTCGSTKGQRSQRHKRLDSQPQALSHLFSEAAAPSAQTIPQGIGVVAVATGLKSLANALTSKLMAGSAAASQELCTVGHVNPDTPIVRCSKRLSETGTAERFAKKLREMQEAL